MWDGGWSCGNGTHCEAVTLQTGTAVLCLAAGPGEERTGHRASAHTIYQQICVRGVGRRKEAEL